MNDVVFTMNYMSSNILHLEKVLLSILNEKISAFQSEAGATQYVLNWPPCSAISYSKKLVTRAKDIQNGLKWLSSNQNLFSVKSENINMGMHLKSYFKKSS